MNSAPLQLKRIAFSEISLRANPAGKSGGSYSLEHFQDVRSTSEELREFHVRLEVFLRSDPQNPNTNFYEGNIVVEGDFEVHPEFPNPQRLVEVNGVSMLWGSIREMVANVTARCQWGLLMLPTVSFASAGPTDGPMPTAAITPALAD